LSPRCATRAGRLKLPVVTGGRLASHAISCSPSLAPPAGTRRRA
jgi:hypothetical protein